MSEAPSVVDVPDNELDPLSPVPRFAQIAAILRHGIESGEYPPGQPIPSQTQIMGRWGVARMTASRAVAELVNENLVVIVPGLGAYVRPR